MRVAAVLVCGLFMLAASPVLAQEAGNAGRGPNMEILKEKLKADKKLLVAENMVLTDAEAKVFWPLYDAYQTDLNQLDDRLGKVISDYASAYNEGKGMITNDTAQKLLTEALAIDEAEVKLKRSSAEKVGKVLPATKTARYIQMESKIRALIKFELASNIPLVY